MKRDRIVGIDVARGLASILMIQGHAFDAWGSPQLKTDPRFTIESQGLQTLALPAFMVLSGAALALRLEAVDRRREDVPSVRRALAIRGLRIVLVGYALNAFSALLDGWESAATFFRADVLHAIGLSLMTLVALGVRARADGSLDQKRMMWISAALGVVPVLLCPWISAHSRAIPLPLGYFAGLWVEVPSVTRMPVVPLIAWTSLGVLVGRAWTRANERERSPRGAPIAVVGATLAASLAIAFAAALLQREWLSSTPGELSRAHPAVIANALTLGARGTLVMAVGAGLSLLFSTRVREELARLGRRSIWAYAFHIPFCYGRLGAPWAGALDGLYCTLAAILLVAASYGVVRLRDRFVRAGASERREPA